MAGVRHPGVLAWLHLVRVFDKMARLAAGHMAGYNLTHAQFDVLAQLHKHQGINQQELSEHLLVTKGNVCGLLDRMEARGLVERRSDPEDRRANMLYLTEEGERLAAEVIPAQEQFLQEKMSSLTAEEQQALNVLLRQLDRSLKPD